MDSDNENNPQTLRSQLLANGWTPLPVYGKGTRIHKGRRVSGAMKDWSKVEITEDWLATAPKRFKNTAIRTGRILAVDIDITDEAFSPVATAITFEVLGETTFKRIGKNPKILLCYWIDEPIRKLRTSKYEGHQVEILSRGSYFVAYGEHPDTKKPYQWLEDEPASSEIDELPSVTEAQVKELVGRLDEMLAGHFAKDEGQTKLGANGEESDLEDSMVFQVVHPFDDMLSWADLKRQVPKDETWFCNLTAFRPDSDSGGGLISWGGSGLHLHDLVTGITHYESDGITELGEEFKHTFGEEHFTPPPPQTYREREQALASILPKFTPSILDKPKRNVNGEYAAVQPSIPINVGAALDALEVDVRRNLQAKTVEPVWRSPDRYRLCKGELGYDEGMARDAIWQVCEHDLRMKNRSVFDEALAQRAEPYHPFEDWLDNLEPWDHVDRLNALSNSVQVVEEYENIWPIYLKRWLLQVVEAARGWRKQPPEQKAAVLVLVGPQGCGKSTWLSALVPAEFFGGGVALHFDKAPKDTLMLALSRTIVELGELETTFKRSDAGALKAFLSNTEDRYRPPYAREVVTWPRCTVYAGSVNTSGFLADETGSRRFWPVNCERCDAFHGVDIRQLWAQVDYLHGSGADWRLNDVEDAIRVRQAEGFEQTSDVRDLFYRWIDTHDDTSERHPVTVTDMATLLDIHRDPRKLGLLKTLLENEYGAERTIKGKRRAFLIPAEASELNSRGIPLTLLKMKSAK